MPSYADLNPASPGSPATVAASISVGYYATDGQGTPSSSGRVLSGKPPRTSSSAGPWKTAKMSPSKTSKVVPACRLGSSSAKYEKLVNDTGVVISALPAKLQPMFSRFDISGDGVVDLNELGVAAELYQRQKDRRKLAWLQTLSVILAFLATSFILAFAIQSAQQGSGCVANAQLLPFLNFTGVTGSKGQNEGIEKGSRNTNRTESKLSRSTIKSLKDMVDSLEAMEEDPDGILADLEYTVETLEQQGAAIMDALDIEDPGDAVMVVGGKAFRLHPSWEESASGSIDTPQP